MSKAHKKLPTWSDSLFSCVYQWVKQGKPPEKADAEAAMLRYPPDSPLGGLAIRMRSLVLGGDVTPEWLCEQGYQSGTHPDKAEEKRKAVVLEFIEARELSKVLSDSVRADYLWPPIAPNNPNSEKNLSELGDGTRINEEDRSKLEELNEIYTHVLAFGDHHVVSMKANIVTKETHAFQTLNSFRNNFLDSGRVAGRRLGGAWLEWPGHSKKLEGVGFYPNTRLCPDNIYNLFTGLSVQPISGDVSPYLEHLERVICAGDTVAYQYLVGWLAHLFQKPEEKPSVAIVMKSIEGTGKGSMVRPIQQILGMYAVHVNGAGQIAGRFNGTIANKLFVFVDEAELTDPRQADKLNAIISEPTINLERKGKEPEPMPNYARFIFASNHERVIRAGLRERRYLVLEPDGTKAQNKGYFDRLHHWIDNNGAERLLAYLLQFDLSTFDPRRPPVTAALVEEKLASLPPAYQFIYSELWSGRPFNGQERIFATELVEQFITWCDAHGEDVKPAAARSIIGKVMSRLGFEPQGRPDRGQGKYYPLPDVSVMRDGFAALLGEESSKVFNT